MNKFKVGDRVKVSKNGKFGVVCDVDVYKLSVILDEYPNYVMWAYPEVLEHVSDSKFQTAIDCLLVMGYDVKKIRGVYRLRRNNKVFYVRESNLSNCFNRDGKSNSSERQLLMFSEFAVADGKIVKNRSCAEDLIEGYIKGDGYYD